MTSGRFDFGDLVGRIEAIALDQAGQGKVGFRDIAAGVMGDPLAIDADGCRVLPDAPGLGVEMDWDWIDDHTLEVIRTGDTPT